MSRPRVVLAGPAPGERGGIGTSASLLLASPLARDFDLHPLTTTRPRPGAREWQFAAALLELDTRLRRGEVDLLHLHLSGGGSFARKALLAVRARAAGVPVVLQVRGSRFFDLPARGQVSRRAVRALLDSARAVVVLSSRAAVQVGEWTSNPEVHVVPNIAAPRPPVDPPVPPPRRVLYLGALREAKGVSDLVRAVPDVVAALGEVDFVLAGEGEAGGIRALAADLGVSARVVCPGWLGAEEKARALAGCHVLVHPSHREQMPNAVLEGMAAGRPVVGSDVDGIPDCVEDGVTGRLVPPRDPGALARALIDVLSDPDRARRMGRAGRERARARFAPEVVAAALGQVWSRALGGRP